MSRWLMGILMCCMSLAAFAAPNEADKRALMPLAQQGDIEAQFQLGQSYCCGLGAGYDTTEALLWFCRAALQGHPGAQFELGQQYSMASVDWRPFNTTTGVIQAYMWYDLAAEQGYPLAGAYKVGLERQMSKGELRQARALKGRWHSIGCKD